MKEKRYTLPEEQKDAAFAAEPAPAYHGNAAIALPEDECAEEDIDWNKISVGWHPANEEEAVARIEAIEAEYERTGVSYNEEEFFNKLNEERTWSNADDFEKELTAQYPWLEDWKRSISIEDFRKNCKKKLKSLFLTKNGI